MSQAMRWADIDGDAARRNLQRFRETAPKVMAVVKSECYGHGRALAGVFAKAGADWLAAATLEEAITLRGDGISTPILVLGQTEADRAAEAAARHITLEVGCTEFAQALSREAVRARVTVDCHMKIDTGMGRIGFDASRPETVDAVLAAAKLPGLRFTGIFQHFAVSDVDTPEANAFTARQYALFTETVDACARRGLTFPLRHCCNSAAAIRFPAFHLDMVRAGISLYGLPAGDAGLFGCEPVLSWRAMVTQVKRIEAGRSVSYGREFIAEHPTEIATISLGYADGYRRLMAGKGQALVRGKRAPVVGRVCMDQLMLDVTGMGVRPGDVATFIGRDGAETLSCTEMAEALGTIEYEVTCLIGARVDRVLHV